ncbi:GTP-sensing pleiotropic transcriptional regulator CodY [Schwartzia succinivorans]|jgi:transcriptional pleiotropic repressor|uniref:Global transcriptional regulator CodY n=1 Tax=Schwartzia succinivorans DSM 10502 TaxID=1123243 RepID=A0A1M4TC61_9FIRM|nr:GTP-sensing pleiotropic transcriptional regulator CodY [Schwartzia succinivorans]MBQ1917993.1 GTP-sensing pleiotropic transcriptional regulator CodY [Schwartzia sp. (in: firmicutes)]MBE6097086.1 GTP-sensing pleiotropic transcriptional regulator CodY [Schwartzia succinivorans]MBQ3863128.1 GTP-sensing pleiotropic transcriptional regulator CodY [Schwartzia sp. (in: firmicutes)]MBQ5413802.1 GTP-sensing pleiotropic transcriptional regulator CodY [Schwartzia sp. (in: firmicutes)]MCR5447580.1 GTP-
MPTLLERARKINRLLQRSETVEFDSISRVLCNVIGANVYITNKSGKIYGYAFVDDFECELMIDKVINQGQFPKNYVKWMLKIDETSANLRSKSGMCAFATPEQECMFNGKNTTIVPIYGVGERIGTMIIAKYNEEFTDDDLLLAEYGATVVGMEMLRDRTQQIEIEARKRTAVQIALANLSFSEIKAVSAIVEGLKELDKPDDPLVASKIADSAKITRSVIVNALRKLESADIMESKSLGMRGTHIKIKNEYLEEELANFNR